MLPQHIMMLSDLGHLVSTTDSKFEQNDSNRVMKYPGGAPLQGISSD